jgi:two-component system, LytTR family, sensor kinase
MKAAAAIVASTVRSVDGRIRGAALVVGAWTLLTLLYLPQTYILNQRAPEPLSLGWAFVATSALFYIWAMLTPLVLWIGRHFPFERGVAARRFVVHLGASFAVSALHLALLLGVNRVLMPGTPKYEPPVPAVALVVGYGATNVMIYWGVLAAGQALTYFRRYQDREFRLVEAQLQSLRSQLHPHFLFNTLNAVTELIYQEPQRAERTVTQLSGLLRLALSRAESEQVTLSEELDFLRNYLAIQQTLLQQRLTVRWNVSDETLTSLVPTMLLQPLVENAVRHGLAARVQGGTLTIDATRDADRLVLRVEDDGAGVRNGYERLNGVGLPNTRARLAHLYADQHTFSIEPRAAGGTVVTIALPFRSVMSQAVPA